MNLCEALRLRPREVVVFVGGSGKTTAMVRLAGERASAGQCVITTTTTHLGADQTAFAPIHVISPPADIATIRSALHTHLHVLVTGPLDLALGKATSVPENLIKQWCTLPEMAAVLVEADGARQPPLKAPADHEPAIPAFATHVVIVVGLEVLGQPLTEAVAHRPERIAALAGLPIGPIITPDALVCVRLHPQGGLKNIPARALVSILLKRRKTLRLLTWLEPSQSSCSKTPPSSPF